MLAIGLTVLVAQLVAIVAIVVNGVTGLVTSLFQAALLVTPAIVMSMAQGILFISIVLLGDLWFGLAGIIWALTRTEVLVVLAGVGMWLASRGRIDRGPAAGSDERAEAALEQATVRRGARPGGAGAAGGASAPQGRVPLRATPLRSRASSA
ncbi:hypothetical protein [Curtobacterium sp. MCBD17_023]|uniref:hypothetical protein n=1 Tax=Curtobacterium sp. MCBD17_023 TaxID=2175657 RepID=UPI0011B4E9BE|nr:hypothetical protein [Curtobacterium sp. MCBD17_023]